MKEKKRLVKQLMSDLDKPIEMFCSSEAAVKLAENPDFVYKISAYKTPEITKLICNNDKLLHYNENSIFYKLKTIFELEDFKEYLNLQVKDGKVMLPYSIVEYLDYGKISEIYYFFEDYILKGKDLSLEIKKYTDKLQIMQDKQEEYKKSLKEEYLNNGKSTEEISELIVNDVRLEKMAIERKKVDGEKTVCHNKLLDIKKFIKDNEILYKAVKKIKENYDKIVNENRKKLLKYIDIEVPINIMIECLLNDTEVEKYIKEKFANKITQERFIVAVKNSQYDIMEMLYLLNVKKYANLDDYTFNKYITSNPERAYSFLLKWRQQNKISNYFTEEQIANFLMSVIESITLLNKEEEYIKNFLDSLSNIELEALYQHIYNSNKNIPKTINFMYTILPIDKRIFIVNKVRMLITEDNEQIGEVLISELTANKHLNFDERNDMIVRVVKILEESRQEYYINYLDYEEKYRKVKSEIFIKLSQSVEMLELFTSDIMTNPSKVIDKVRLDTNLKNIVLELRNGLSGLGIYTLADEDEWYEQKEIKCIADEHEITGDIRSGDTVKLRSLGFVYKNGKGAEEVVYAKVNKVFDHIKINRVQNSKQASATEEWYAPVNKGKNKGR